MLDMSMITKPVVGAVIGYSTNWLAIKMLFKPHAAKYVGKFRIPFTPGLIPKERERIARSLGTAVGERLLTDEVISKELLDEKVIEHIKSYVIRDLLSRELTAGAVMRQIFGDDYPVVVAKIAKSLNNYLNEQMQSEAQKERIESEIKNYLMEHATYNMAIGELVPEGAFSELEHILESQKDNISQFIVEESKNEAVVAKLKEIVSTMLMEKVGALGAMFVNPDDIAVSILGYIEKTVYEESFQTSMVETIMRAVSKGTMMQVSDMIPAGSYDTLIDMSSKTMAAHAYEVSKSLDLKAFIEQGLDVMLNKPIVLSERDKEKIEVQVETLYREFVNTHIGTFLETFELKAIVESEVNAFSVEDIEKLIFTIVDKELKAITWFGALLGFIMGITMIFI